MVSLHENFLSSRFNFDSKRVTLSQNEVNTVPREKESRFGRIYRFLTFHKDSKLTAVNRALAEGFKSGALINDIAKKLLANPAKFDESKENVLANIKSLNEKFIKGNQNNFLSRMALKVINAVRYVFRMDFIGYHELNTKDIADKLEAELARQLNTQDDDSFQAAMNSNTPIPAALVPLLLTEGSSSSGPLNVGAVVRALPADQLARVERLFTQGQLPIANHDFQAIMGGSVVDVGIRTTGNVTLKLTEEELESLQRTLTGQVNKASRLLVALLLVGADGKAPLLLDAVKEGRVKDVDGAVKLLTEAKKGSKPQKSFLDRITDAKNPPEAYVGGKPCRVRVDTKKACFQIENMHKEPIFVTRIGYWNDGRYFAFNDVDLQKPQILVQRGEANYEGVMVQLDVPKNFHYRLSRGGDSIEINLPTLKNMKVEEVV